MIELRGVSKRFGELAAVHRLDLLIERGEIFGFLGPNGAGKTTTVKLLTGLIGVTIALEAWPVQMHFQERFGRAVPWEPLPLVVCAGGLALANLAAFGVPWGLGRMNLEAYEER
ncbi:MAG: ATP-binding cassette domain-containing protein [Elusimicrobia bacterium]|nr:ATP-binding cassette domain-containing protein [Elusimicrobiota bacterium]